jgi:hypothetical protein
MKFSASTKGNNYPILALNYFVTVKVCTEVLRTLSRITFFLFFFYQKEYQDKLRRKNGMSSKKDNEKTCSEESVTNGQKQGDDTFRQTYALYGKRRQHVDDLNIPWLKPF